MDLCRTVSILLLLVCLAAGANAKTYWVAATGSDSGPGSRDAPFRTIQRAAEAMGPGDTCVVRKGLYRETIRPARSGAPGKPVVFRAADGEVVTIIGTEPVTGWKKGENGVYSAELDFATGQLFADGSMMTEARWPNTGPNPLRPMLAIAGDGTTQTSIIDRAIPFPKEVVEGSLMHVTPGARWVSWTRRIKTFDPEKHEMTFDVCGTDWAHAVNPGSRYYLIGKREFLDAPGEWFQDRNSGEVYLIPPAGADPSKLRVEAKKRQMAFDLSKLEHIHVRGFRMFACTVTMADASFCLVEDCHIKHPSHFVECEGWGTGMDDTGVVVSGHDNEIRKCSISWSAGNGISLLGEKNRVTNCLIHDVDYAAVDCSAVRAFGKGHVISHNTMFNSGRSILVHRYLRAGRIEYNHLHNPGLLTTDLGCTYCFDTDGEGTTICYNWVHDNHAPCGVGIYVDNNSPNHVVHHNVSWGNENSGIRINTPCRNGQFYNNTVFSNGDSFHHWGTDDVADGTRVVNNAGSNKAEFAKGAIVENNKFEIDLKLMDPKSLDFRPRPDSPLVDAGVEIPGFTDGFKGKAPDLGAYEFGAERWTAGHDWGDAPEVNY